MGWAGHMARIGNIIYKKIDIPAPFFFSENLRERKQFEDLGVAGDNIKIDLT
jgi:hypothetical protein